MRLTGGKRTQSLLPPLRSEPLTLEQTPSQILLRLNQLPGRSQTPIIQLEFTQRLTQPTHPGRRAHRLNTSARMLNHPIQLLVEILFGLKIKTAILLNLSNSPSHLFPFLLISFNYLFPLKRNN
jgi:hypothetical protein